MTPLSLKDNDDALDSLKQASKSMLDEAKAFKSECVQTRLENAYRAFFEDNYGDCSSGDDKNSRDQFVVNFLRVKQKSLIAQIKSVFTNTTDPAFGIEPTPEPDLPHFIKMKGVDAIKQLLYSVGVPSDEALNRFARQFKAAARSYWAEEGRVRTGNMQMVMEDQLEQGDWRIAINEHIEEFGWAQTTTTKGPFLAIENKTYYKGDTLHLGPREHVKFQHIKAWDVFPSRDSTNGRDGTYFAHADRHCWGDIYNFLDTKSTSGFIDSELEALIDEFENGEKSELEAAVADTKSEDDDASHSIDYENWFTSTINRGIFEKADYGPQEFWGSVEVMKLYAKIPGRVLEKWGVASKNKKLDVKDQHELELWLVGDYLIYAAIDPYEVGERPFHTSSFCRDPGKFWGYAPNDIAGDVQKVINASGRSLIRNMSYASGPFATAIGRRFSEGTPTELEPWKVYDVTDDFGSGHRAMQFHDTPSNANELISIMSYHIQALDQLLSIPSYLHGGQPNSSLRGVNALQFHTDQTLKPFQAIVADWDLYFIEPMIKQLYQYNMFFWPNDNVKFDAQVKARGTASLLRREVFAQQSIQNFQLLLQTAQTGIPVPGIEAFGRRMVEAQGMDPDEVFGNSAVGNLLNATGASVSSPPQANTGGSGPPVYQGSPV